MSDETGPYDKAEKELSVMLGDYAGQSETQSRLRTYNTRHPISASHAIMLDGIEGVESVVNSKYEVTVTIGALFSWEEVEPRVLAVLKGE